MRTLVSLVILQLFLLSCSQKVKKEPITVISETTQTKESHTLLFYNVENLFDTIDDPKTYDEDFLPDSKKQWNQERFNSKIEKLAEVISAVNPEGPLLIGLVEVENSFVIEQLIGSEKLSTVNYDYAHFESPDERGIDVGLIYNADYFTVQSKEALTVNLAANDKTRDILYVKGTVSGENKPYHIFVNHWPSRREGAEKSEPNRVSAATILRNKIDEIQKVEADAKIIVMGDFNDYPDNNSIKTTLKAKNNTTISNDQLFNLAAKLDENDKGTYNYRGDWGMLDQIIVSTSLLSKKPGSYSVEQDGLKIFEEEFILFYDKKYKEFKPNKTYGGNNYYGGYSDHLPIYIQLERNSK